MPQIKKRLVLIDTNALMHRAYHALPPLTTKKGEVVNAVYGFTSILLKILKELKPDYIACAFDMAAPTFRHIEFKDYKAHRVKAPDEFYNQIPKIKEVIAAFGIPIYEKEGFEADDIIGTIAYQAPKMFARLASRIDSRLDSIIETKRAARLAAKREGDYEIVILTGDLDTLQLVNSRVRVYTFKKGINDTAIYDEKAVEERYGLKPNQMIDFKGLRGDPSDNIPGVPGIGEKTASALLKEFESIDSVYKNFDTVKEKIKPNTAKKLEEFKEQVFFSKYLASIRLDAPIEFNLNQSAKRDFDRQKLAKLFQELEFFSLIRRLDNGNGKPEESAASIGHGGELEFKIIKTDEDIKEFAGYAKKQKEFSFAADYKFSNYEYELLKLGMASGGETREIIFSELGGEEKKEINKILKDIFEDATLEKIGHDLKNGIRALDSQGIDLGQNIFDTMAAAYLLSPGKRNYSLEKIFFEKTGEEIPKDGAGKTAAAILILAKILKTELEKNKMASLAKQIEFPLIEVLANMEAMGVKIDIERLKSLSLKIGGKIEELRKKIFALCGEEFNINSTRELSRILFEKLKIPAKGVKKTKTDYSTAADTLEQIKFLHPVAPLISQYRELAKIKSTYTDALPELISPKTGRIHTTFNQVLTATGRLSSSDPNLQNIPIKTEIGNEIRMAFVPENKDWLLLSLDYSQIELRIVASMANDEKMLGIFADGGDIHTETAAEIQGVAPEQVTERMRNAAKALNFGIIYGISSHGFSQATGMPREEAQDFIDRYLARFYGVSRFIEEAKESAQKKGYAETIFGRRRWLPELNSPNFQVRSAAERMAINMPIQGTAADIIKLAMIAIDKKYKGDKNINLILQVHDELVFEVKKENPPAGGAVYAEEIRKIMENVYMLKAPLKVSASIGENWGEMSALGGSAVGGEEIKN